MSKLSNEKYPPSEIDIIDLLKENRPSPSKNFYKNMSTAPWLKTRVSWKHKSFRLAFSLGVFAVILLFSPGIYNYSVATNTPTPSQTPTASGTAEISYFKTVQPNQYINTNILSTRTPQQ